MRQRELPTLGTDSAVSGWYPAPSPDTEGVASDEELAAASGNREPPRAPGPREGVTTPRGCPPRAEYR